MYQYTFYFALNTLLTDTAENTQAIMLCSDFFNDYTIQQVNGVYKNNVETSYILTVISKSNKDKIFKSLTVKLKKSFKQDCTLLTKKKLTECSIL